MAMWKQQQWKGFTKEYSKIITQSVGFRLNDPGKEKL